MFCGTGSPMASPRTQYAAAERATPQESTGRPLQGGPGGEGCRVRRGAGSEGWAEREAGAPDEAEADAADEVLADTGDGLGQRALRERGRWVSAAR